MKAHGLTFCLLLSIARFVASQQQCYFAPGAQYRAPSSLVPCNGTGVSACCLLGDTCLSGNTCYNHATGNLYQYGCTDINYEDQSCPYKCGLDPNRSPWIALEYCSNVQDVSNTWICHSPDTCGCEWQSSYDLLVLEPRGCKEMGSEAYVAISAPISLAPYVSLPSTYGGSTGYYSPTISDGTRSWISTAVPGYTPEPFTQLTTYRPAPRSKVQVDSDATPGPSTYASARSYTAPASRPTTATQESSESTNTASGTVATTAPSPAATLSTGAKAGLGIGIGGGVCLIAALGICLYLLHRRKPTRTQPEGSIHPYLAGRQMHIQSPYHSPPVQWSSTSYHDHSAGNKTKHSPPPVPSPPMELFAGDVGLVHELGSKRESGIVPPPVGDGYDNRV